MFRSAAESVQPLLSANFDDELNGLKSTSDSTPTYTSSSWGGYANSSVENPLAVYLIERFSLQERAAVFHSWRWRMTYPLQRRVAIGSNWCTLGELFVVPMVLAFVSVPIVQFMYDTQIPGAVVRFSLLLMYCNGYYYYGVRID
jgi:hypothetical protein